MKKRHWRLAELEKLESRRLLATDLGNVLFLGDSITHGTGQFDSYRYELWKNFIDPPSVPNSSETFEFDFQFVGTQTAFFNSTRTLPDHNGMAFPNIHEGHLAWTTNNILNGGTEGHNPPVDKGKLDDWLTGYDVDLAFIHLATNDLRTQLTNPAGNVPSIDNIGTIIDKIQADSPTATIFVAQIIPYYKISSSFPDQAALDGYNDNINGFNDLVESSVDDWSTSSSRVYAVNQHDLDPLPLPGTPDDPANWIPESDYIDGVHLLSGAPSKRMADYWFDALQATPPTITDVRVSSSGWTPSFVNAIDTELNLGYRLPNGASQTDTLPWVDTDQIHITFEEEVVIDESDVSLTGIFGETYAFPPGSVTFDDSINTATISLPPNMKRDALTLTIADSVTDLTGNSLDGEWIDNQTLPRSGNGFSGGDFVFSLNILPGDATQNSFVDGNDLSLARELRFVLVGDPNFAFTTDVDGNGFIDGNDLSEIRDRRFDNLFPPVALADPLFADPPTTNTVVGKLDINAAAADKFAEEFGAGVGRRKGKFAKFGLGKRASAVIV